MKDTPDHVRRLYSDFVMNKTNRERFKMGFEMADVGQRMVEEQFGQQHPDWSVGELKAPFSNGFIGMIFPKKK